jgi:hypothetical protein
MSKRSRSLDELEDTPASRRNWCCWPKCLNQRTSEIPLCTAHITIAHGVWENTQSNDRDDTVYAFTAYVSEPQPAKPERKPTPHGTVYYVRSGGFIKIGWTSSLQGRMKAYPPDSVLLATEPGTRADETRRHRQFAAHRTHGREWYAMTADLMRHIDRVKTDHGEPDTVAFAAQPVKVPQPRPKQYVGGNYRGNGLIGEARRNATPLRP